MPILSDSRHERFAQNLASGMKQGEAYEKAGYAPSRAHAARLAAKGNIGQRVAELQQPAAEQVSEAMKAAAEAGTARSRVARAIYAKLEAAIPDLVIQGAADVKALTDASLAIEKDERVVDGGVSDRTETKETGAFDEIASRLARLTAERRTGQDPPRVH